MSIAFLQGYAYAKRMVDVQNRMYKVSGAEGDTDKAQSAAGHHVVCALYSFLQNSTFFCVVAVSIRNELHCGHPDKHLRKA